MILVRQSLLYKLIIVRTVGESAVEYRKEKLLKQYKEHRALNIKSFITRYDYEESYNEGFADGVDSIVEKFKQINTKFIMSVLSKIDLIVGKNINNTLRSFEFEVDEMLANVEGDDFYDLKNELNIAVLRKMAERLENIK